MLGVEWKEQEYIIGYKPKTEEIHEIGFNYDVGSKWPSKGMPMGKWQELERRLVNLGYKVSWQKGLKDLDEYMDWVNSCKLLISTDSLGSHIALAFHKRVIVLFGPTDPRETYFYKRSTFIRSEQKCEHMPCFRSKCIIGEDCMKSINLHKVVESVQDLTGEKVVTMTTG